MLKIIGYVWLSGVGVLVFVFLLIYLRANGARRLAMKIKPKAGEVWVQDGQHIYIKSVAKHGVLIVAALDTGGAHQWWDSWNEWETRVRERFVVKTEQTISFDPTD